MNKNKRKNVKKGTWKPTERELEEYFGELVIKLNWRLFMESIENNASSGDLAVLSAVFPKKILLVDSITIISYEEAQGIDTRGILKESVQARPLGLLLTGIKYLISRICGRKDGT